ncbi:MAG: hypothetical protein KY475_12015, partial [Planctomycetes bacterium]|nr:hypothetical protein [Planctomycetota bacterium]
PSDDDFDLVRRTALELAADIGRYLADAPVSAYREPLALRAARWARRHRTTAHSMLAALLLLAVAGTAAAVWLGRQAQRERHLHAEAEVARENEASLRKQSLQVSAEFAARTLANQIDIRWRILEKEAADPELLALLQQANAEPDNEALRRPLQDWLDERVDQRYPHVPTRTWHIQTENGIQAARRPSEEEDGEPASSLGKNFAFRDYFHGRGMDYSPQERIELTPLSAPHNSTVLRSTVNGELTVALSVPIRAAEDAAPIGILAMTIELGEFADLAVQLPEGQGVLLVESRRYYMLGENLQPNGERGEGLVLHHERLKEVFQQNPLPHVDDEIVHAMLAAKLQWQAADQRNPDWDNLLSERYRDPLCENPESRWLAAFAPVLVHGRPADQSDTGWFVIVQQQR